MVTALASRSADVAEFKRALRDGDLERAASLYSGPLLDGFHLDGSGEFERWVNDERSVLAAQVLEVFESLAARAIAAGDLPANMVKEWSKTVMNGIAKQVGGEWPEDQKTGKHHGMTVNKDVGLSVR